MVFQNLFWSLKSKGPKVSLNWVTWCLSSTCIDLRDTALQLLIILLPTLAKLWGLRRNIEVLLCKGPKVSLNWVTLGLSSTWMTLEKDTGMQLLLPALTLTKGSTLQNEVFLNNSVGVKSKALDPRWFKSVQQSLLQALPDSLVWSVKSSNPGASHCPD